MFLYCYELNDESKAMCTITTPFCLYRYTHLAMGIKVLPDIALSIINQILDKLDTKGYIDDCGYWSAGTFEQHLDRVDTILTRLEEIGMKCNPLKCDWLVQETDFLCHWMTPTHIKPMKKKINAILRMGRPNNTTEVCSFIDAVNVYKSLFPCCPHLLPLLTILTGTNPFSWNDKKEFILMLPIIKSELQ